MNSWRPQALVLAPVMVALLVGLAGAAAAGEGPVVREIQVRGFPGDAAIITDLMQTKVGRRLDPVVLNDDLARLLKAGHLATIRQAAVPDGVRIIVDIVEGLRVGTVRVTGAGRSWNRRLEKEILTRPGDPVSAAVLQQPESERWRGDKDRIRTWCQIRGYRAVTAVSQTTQVPGTDRLDLLFTVELGPKHQVKWLRFVGNVGIPSGELRRRMQTRRDTLLTSRRFYEKSFQEDLLAIEDYYRFKGYPNAEVRHTLAFRGPRARKVDITIVIEEGQQYPTATVTIEGNEAISTDTLMAAIPLKPGETYSDERLLQSAERIERLYQEIGYPFVAVQTTRDLTPAGDAFDARLSVTEGERITINTAYTRGNRKTRPEVILRELELEPGMVYDIRRLERSERALGKLQYFEELSLQLVPTEPAQEGERDLLVQVTEGDTGYVRFGLGFSSSDAFVGAIELVQRNFDYRDPATSWSDLISGNAFTGAGQLFRVAAYPGTIYSNYLIQYNNPYWGGRNLSFGWSVYYRERDQGEWDERRIGARVNWGIRKYRGDPDTDLIYHTRVEAVSVRNVDEDDAPDDAEDEEGTHPLLGLGVTWQRDRTDRPLLPTSGYEWEFGPELVIPHGVKLGGSETIFWTIGRKRPPGHERVVSVRGQVDYALGDFPIYERYYAGAPLLRGFEYRGAGPTDNDEPIGGEYRVILSAEYRHPLVPNTLYGVLFTDAGTVTEDLSVFGDPRVAVGFGFRLVVPQISRAPLSLDFGFPILKEHDDETEVVFFSIRFDR